MDFTLQRDLIREINDDINFNGKLHGVDYYQIITDRCLDLEKFLRQYHTDLPTSIYLAQYWQRGDLIPAMLSKIKFTPAQKNKINNLAANNTLWYETTNLGLLDPKYDFLQKHLDYFATNMYFQEAILSLDEAALHLFRQLYQHLNQTTNNPMPYLCRLLNLVGQTIKGPLRSLTTFNGGMLPKRSQHFQRLALQTQDQNLTSQDLDKILYVFTNNNETVPLNNYQDLQNFDQIFDVLDEAMVGLRRQTTWSAADLRQIKSLVIGKSFGFDLDYAQYLLDRFDLTDVDVGDYNQEYVAIYHSLQHLVNENDPEKLFAIYQQIQDNHLDYATITLLENGLRDVFNQHLNQQFWRTGNRPYQVDNGVPIYDAGTDFKIMMTAVGAYQTGLEPPTNWANYWNRKSIRSHGNCCSLIANDNLATAPINNVCLGFTAFAPGSLLAANDDINSTPTSTQLNTQDHAKANFMAAQNIIDHTRGDYNEFVYERRDLAPHPQHFKKNPAYVVYFEEFSPDTNLNELDTAALNLLTDQQQKYQLSLQAARDFRIPIVKINREVCAASEHQKIFKMLADFQTSGDPALLPRIITTYENNRTGLHSPHQYLRHKYFSTKQMKQIINQLVIAIQAIPDASHREQCQNALQKVVLNELSKQEHAKTKSYGQKSSLNNFSLAALVFSNGRSL